jgi:SET domain-containing protein
VEATPQKGKQVKKNEVTIRKMVTKSDEGEEYLYSFLSLMDLISNTTSIRLEKKGLISKVSYYFITTIIIFSNSNMLLQIKWNHPTSSTTG